MKILITGVTSGIGKQLALDYCNDGHEVWGTGRNKAKLEAPEAEGINTLGIDLTDREQSLRCFSQLKGVDFAILNAGTCEYIDMPDSLRTILAKKMVR